MSKEHPARYLFAPNQVFLDLFIPFRGEVNRKARAHWSLGWSWYYFLIPEEMHL